MPAVALLNAVPRSALFVGRPQPIHCMSPDLFRRWGLMVY